MAKQITDFINDELKPRFWDNINSIFPDMHFTLKNGKLESLKHYDGSDKKGGGTAPNSIISPNKPYQITDFSMSPKSKDIITLYMERNNIREVWEAVDMLCDVMHLERPEYTPEDRAKYKAYEERRTMLEESLDRQKAALFSPEGAATLNYLKGRGWTEDEIKRAELGYISKDEAKRIGGGGYPYSLSIPSRNGSNLNGFKFRDITWTKASKNPKYLFLSETDRRHFTYLTGIPQTDGTIAIVEGELDALHANVRGVDNIVATAGGAVTPKMLEQAIERGIKRIVLLLDRDEKGEEFVRSSTALAFSKGVSVFVAALPDETLPDGKKVKDVDDYLKLHAGAEDLQALIKGADFGATYLVRYHALQTLNSVGGDATKITPIEYDKLKETIIATINATQNETERYNAVQNFAAIFGMDMQAAISTIKAEADRQRAEAAKIQQKAKAEALIAEATKLKEEGRIEAALAKMEEAGEIRKLNSKAAFSSLLAPKTEEELAKRMREKKGELFTGYTFKSLNGKETENFTLPSGAITFIVAPTSHGKSTLLQNLALQTATNKEEGSVLYFTFEEEGDSVTMQMLNKFMSLELCNQYNSKQSNNIRALTHYYRNGENRFIKAEALEQFNEKRAEFYSQLYNTGKLSVFYEDYDSSQLIAAIRYLNSQLKVKAVFIDYIQLLSKRGCKLQRTEELKEICLDLKDLCIETQLPIIVAAQANREVSSPLEMENRRIAEAADLERIANKILFLWNSSFKPQLNKDTKKDIEDWESRTGITLGESGKIYAKLTKNRGGSVNIEAVLDYNGNTGVITQGEIPEGKQGKVNYKF